MAVAVEGRVLAGGWVPELPIPAVFLVLFNLLDGVFTLAFLQAGVAEELNPVMRAAYLASPLTFIILKLAIVQAGVLVLASHAQFRAARVALTMGALLYSAIVVYHLVFGIRFCLS